MDKDGFIIFLKTINAVALVAIAFAVSIYVYYWLHKYNEGCAKSSNVEDFVETYTLDPNQAVVTASEGNIKTFNFGTDILPLLPEIDVKDSGNICIGTSCINKKNIDDILKTTRGSGNIALFNVINPYASVLLTIPVGFVGTLDVIGDIGTRSTIYIQAYANTNLYQATLLEKDVTLSNGSKDKIKILFQGNQAYVQNTGAGWSYRVFWTLQSLI